VPYEIPDFRTGKQVTNGRPTPTPPFLVTVVRRDEAQEFFRARNRTDLQRHLRGLRDLGLLVHHPRRLTHRVKVGEHNADRMTAYVVRGPIGEVPRLRDRQRVGNW
jgi:hypothetical protein